MINFKRSITEKPNALNLLKHIFLRQLQWKAERVLDSRLRYIEHVLYFLKKRTKNVSQALQVLSQYTIMKFV